MVKVLMIHLGFFCLFVCLFCFVLFLRGFEGVLVAVVELVVVTVADQDGG